MDSYGALRSRSTTATPLGHATVAITSNSLTLPPNNGITERSAKWRWCSCFTILASTARPSWRPVTIESKRPCLICRPLLYGSFRACNDLLVSQIENRCDGNCGASERLTAPVQGRAANKCNVENDIKECTAGCPTN